MVVLSLHHIHALTIILYNVILHPELGSVHSEPLAFRKSEGINFIPEHAKMDSQ